MIAGAPGRRADQGDRRGAHPLVGCREAAAKHGPVAGDRERVAGHVESFHALGGSAVSAQDHRRLRERHHSREAVHGIAQLFVLRMREAAVLILVVDGGDGGDAIGSRDRQPAQRVGVQDREEHVVDADAERQHENGGDAECAVPSEQSNGEPDILPERLQQRKTALLAELLLGLLDSAERTPRRARGIRRRESTRHVLVGEELQVHVNLLVQTVVAPAPEEDVGGPGEQNAERGHDSLSSRRLTMETVRDQSAVSAVSCRRPAAVME